MMKPRNFVIFFLALLVVQLIIVAVPVHAERSLEWRDGDLWVIDEEQDDIYFEPLRGHAESWYPKTAVLSPDGEWVVFARHTGGGYENEGESCFAARWDGTGERMLLETDRLIHDIYWMNGPDSDFIAVQVSTGGTIYRSYFTVVNFDTGEIETIVEGFIYRTSSWGTRFRSGYWDTSLGLLYEVYGQIEEVAGWGIFCVDELIDFGTSRPLLSVDGDDPTNDPLTDGLTSTAWFAPDDSIPSITLELDRDEAVDGISIVSGWSWHETPSEDRYEWEGIDWWPQYGRPGILTIEFADGLRIEEVLEDMRTPQWIGFPSDVDYSTITIYIEGIYHGTIFDEVAISEIYIY